MRRQTRAWRAAPLPFAFHAALDEGRWEAALSLYHAHPYHCPPVDTYDLLKAIMHNTGVTSGIVKHRFGDKVRVAMSLQRKHAEEVDWELYWTALNNGDSKTISMALSGCKVGGVSSQVGVAEACAVLLRSSGRNWKHDLVDSAPYGTVTKSNIIGIALQRSRWDVACEILGSTKVTRQDVSGLWPLVSTLQWELSLRVIGMCPKASVPFEEVIPHLLESGCDIVTLSEYLENSKVLGDSVVVAPLLKKAIEMENWGFVRRCMEHLMDIGSLSSMAHRTLLHLFNKHGEKTVCRQLADKGIPLHSVTIELLEECSF
eukprot:Tbor_TRINITY_DN4960_c0_g1::TRINITY_DN4960_c0_g1_i1::g.9854::m.9854